MLFNAKSNSKYKLDQSIFFLRALTPLILNQLGPASILHHQIEEPVLMQMFNTEMLDALIKQQQAC
jgi:hypothetical protein